MQALFIQQPTSQNKRKPDIRCLLVDKHTITYKAVMPKEKKIRPKPDEETYRASYQCTGNTEDRGPCQMNFGIPWWLRW